MAGNGTIRRMASLSSLLPWLFSRQEVVAGVDVGSFQVRIAIASHDGDRNVPVILGRAATPSRGLRHGYIVDTAAATKVVRATLEAAQQGVDGTVRRAFVAVGGTGLDEFHATGETLVGRPDQVITKADVAAAQMHAEERLAPQLQNYRILHAFPLRYRIDGKEIPVTSPEGLRGSRIAVDFLFVATIEKHLNDLLSAIEEAGLEVAGIYASPIAAAHAMLSKEQRHIGAALVNIGAHTLSLVVYDEGVPVSVKVFPIGASEITKDIALTLKIDTREAELMQWKKVAMEDEVRERVQEITTFRLQEMFRLIDRHLQSIQRSRLLPGGVVITGGGSAFHRIDEIARTVLALPARIGSFQRGPQHIAVKDASWAVAYGALLLGLREHQGNTPPGINPHPSWWEGILEWVRGYLP